jgi:hypothetical protein
MAAHRSIEEIARMTDNYLPAATPPQRYEPFPPESAKEQGTADVVKDQATDLGHSSIETGKHVADVAREQASGVAIEAGRQGKDLLHQAQGQLQEQAARGQQRLASQLLSLSDELGSMAGAPQGGMAADLAGQAASRVRNAGQWLDDREPRQVADEVQSFARRRPAVFLALAVGAGVVAGRLTRGLKDANSDDSTAAAAPAGTQGLNGQWAQPSDMASYPPATTAGVNDQTLGVSVPASVLPPTGGGPAWEASPAYGERSPLVTDDQTGRQGTL